MLDEPDGIHPMSFIQKLIVVIYPSSVQTELRKVR